jgi:hypothetical protein
MRHLAAEGQWLGVDWGAFAIVFAVAFASAVAIVTLYAVGLRLLAVGSTDDRGADGHITSAAHGRRPVAASVGAYVCIGLGVIAVLVGIWLIVPQFH